MTSSVQDITTDDIALTAGLARDLDGCFERLVVAYQRRMYTFALRLTGSPQDAKEIAQYAFVRAYRGLTGYGEQQIVRSRCVRGCIVSHSTYFVIAFVASDQ